MKEIIEKYEAKLNFLNKALEQKSDLMDEDTLDMMKDIRTILSEVVMDFNDLRNKIERIL
jgi:predicted DNA-binding protein YlxM (UPF0122 family)